MTGCRTQRFSIADT